MEGRRRIDCYVVVVKKKGKEFINVNGVVKYEKMKNVNNSKSYCYLLEGEEMKNMDM